MRQRKLHLLVRLVAPPVAGLALAGCGGGGEGGGAVKAPPLTVPGYSGTPKVGRPRQAPGAAAAEASATATAEAPAAAPTPAATAPAQPDPSGDPPAAAATSPQSAPAGDGQFQEFCANNPGAC